MTELTLEALREALAPIRTHLDEVRQGLAAVREELAGMRPQVAGVPLIWQSIENLRHDFRTMRAALNDMARVNITAGEVEALHADIDRMQTRQMELEARIAALEGREP
jgi:uncharacterized coiled-coil protein SlyX